jgi:hypothetical protein
MIVYLINQPIKLPNYTMSLIACSVVVDELCQIVVTPTDNNVSIYLTPSEILRVTSHVEEEVHLIVIQPIDTQLSCFVAQTTHMFFVILDSLVQYETPEVIEEVNNIRDCRRYELPKSITIDEHCQFNIHLQNGDILCFTKSEIHHVRSRYWEGRHFMLIEVFDDTFPAFLIETHMVFSVLLETIVRFEAQTTDADVDVDHYGETDGEMEEGDDDVEIECGC